MRNPEPTEAAIRNIERGPGGGRNWPAEELRRLCAGAEASYQPSYCMHVVFNRNYELGRRHGLAGR